MKRYARRVAIPSALIIVLLAFTAASSYAQPATEERVSAPGQYSGYSQPQYDSWTTTSQYVTMRDGVRIAVDVYVPTDGPEQEAFPSVLIVTPYHRASVTDTGEILNPLNFEPEDRPEGLTTLLSYGYAIVVADVRGTGASFGYRSTIFSPDEQADGNDLLNWIVAQPWSDGNVGMVGASYRAISQLLYAADENPALKCIVPRHALLDLYDMVYPGGLFNKVFVDAYKLSIALLDANETLAARDLWPTKPVDEDTDGSLLAEATTEHEQSFDMAAAAAQAPFRDSTFVIGDGSTRGYGDLAPAGHIQQIEDSGIPIYHMGGWFDAWPRDTLTMMDTLSNPSKVLVGPYYHLQGFEGAPVEYLRWFDWCLKGIDNGIDQEPPYYIYTMGRDEWRFADQWPLPEQQMRPYYFGPDNAITTTKPATSETFDEYVTDYTSKSGEGTRWLCTAGGACEYPERSALDEKNLTYTTPPLQQDLEVTGHPIVHLFASSTATDGALFVYLEDVYPDGTVHYITEGELKASLRKLDTRPWQPDLPWHRAFAEDEQPLTPGQVEEMVIDLLPTSNVFLAGHRLRVSIAGWDADNFTGPQFDPPPTIRMYRDGEHASYIELPIIGEAAELPLGAPEAAPVAELPSTGTGPADGGFDWTPVVVWLLVGSGVVAVAGGLYIQFAVVSRRNRIGGQQ
jgi:putative CocE/NonD family hydrolase